MSVAAVLDGLCTYFGGTYDPAERAYRTPQVAGLGTVRRAFPKRDDKADYYLGMPVGAPTGCQMVMQIPKTVERRTAVPAAHGGWKRVEHTVEMHCFLLSVQSYGEDASDDFIALRDALITHIHADPTCGTGGFETGTGFQLGEGSDLEHSLAEAESRSELSRAYLLITSTAVQYVQA